MWHAAGFASPGVVVARKQALQRFPGGHRMGRTWSAWRTGKVLEVAGMGDFDRSAPFTSITRLDSVLRDANNFPQVTSKKTQFPGSDPLADEIASFVDTVMNGSEPVVSGEDGRRALKYALAIIDQIERGCRDFQAIC